MGVHVIIDGYNMIHTSGILSGHDMRFPEESREELIGLLAAYKKAKAHRITVVFDAQNAPDPGASARRYKEKGIEVVYSRPGQLADAVIKNMASREKEQAVVVTSDRDVAGHSAAAGAAAVTTREFGDRILAALYAGAPEDEGSTGSGTLSTKKKGPSRRAPKQKRKTRKKAEKL